MTEPKKLAPLRILQILQKYSSPEHPLWQEEIQDYLLRDYGVELERKAIGRNLAYLCEAGFHIVNIPKRGCYLEAFGFNSSDLRLVIDAILSSKHIAAEHAKDLVQKVKDLGNAKFSFETEHVEYLGERGEEDMKQTFHALDYVNRAIGSKRQIEFDYDENAKKKHCRAVPRRILLHEQTYYLLAYDGEQLAFYRLDKMSNTYMLWLERDWLSDPGRDEEAEESAIEAFFHKESRREP